jgi:hypothetical protein
MQCHHCTGLQKFTIIMLAAVGSYTQCMLASDASVTATVLIRQALMSTQSAVAAVVCVTCAVIRTDLNTLALYGSNCFASVLLYCSC